MEGLAALITAFGALCASLAGVLVQMRGLRRVREDTAQLQPDHGSSVADKINRIEKNMATRTEVAEVRHLVGHEVGEVRDDITDMRGRLSRLESQ